MTLISLAWQLALFELAVEEGYPHPGFLMIDSPQKNLTPEGAPREDEFGDPAIGAHVWHHLVEVSARLGDRAQLIVSIPGRLVRAVACWARSLTA
jgi:hypothetical protein